MLTYGEMVEWSSLFDTLTNRMGICNQVLGCRHANAGDNPLVCRREGPSYVVRFAGEPISEFGVWDLEGIRDTVALLDHWQDCMWHLSSSRMIAAA